jgi:outer membrane lipoprotein-sorting protein
LALPAEGPLFLKPCYALPAKPADTKPADTKPADTKPADTKPADTKPEKAYPEKNRLTADQIIELVDKNMHSDTKKALCRMIIINQRGNERVLKFVNWIQGDTKSFSEYLSPARERGTKMLKIEKNLWTYSPDSDRIIHISGHLLRQSVMGSDLSYEDSSEDVKLSNDYNAKILSETEYKNSPAWILELKAKKESLAYQLRKIWIHKEKFVPLREERFAKSSRLLKVMEIQEIKKFGTRWYPTKMLYKDVLKSGKGTIFAVDELIFDPPVPASLFSKSSLRR